VGAEKLASASSSLPLSLSVSPPLSPIFADPCALMTKSFTLMIQERMIFGVCSPNPEQDPPVCPALVLLGTLPTASSSLSPRGRRRLVSVQRLQRGWRGCRRSCLSRPPPHTHCQHTRPTQTLATPI
jgi:hypothetical protein